MSRIIGIVDYGISGNVHSIEKAIKKAGGDTIVVNNVEQFSHVDKLVLPGVGSFKDAMEELDNHGFLKALQKTTKPILGICLGMQILSTIGFEYGETQGLGLIEGEVRPILVEAKVPHVGFNNIKIVKSNNILDGLQNDEFYFMHSYEVVNSIDIASVTQYAGHKFVSSIKKDNIYGVQFHPEKSHRFGMNLLKNFALL